MKKIILLLAILSLMLIGCETPETTTAGEITSSTAQTEPTSSSTLSIELVAGQKGLYGEQITLNKGTEFEETYFVYRVPVGTYKVTNMGKYMDQFNVYGDTPTVNEDGWEELADTFYVKVLDVGASDTVTIGEGQIIEIHEPGKYKLEKIQ